MAETVVIVVRTAVFQRLASCVPPLVESVLGALQCFGVDVDRLGFVAFPSRVVSDAIRRIVCFGIVPGDVLVVVFHIVGGHGT